VGNAGPGCHRKGPDLLVRRQSAEQAGVPYIEIAHIQDEIRAFFDYVKQEQQ
jgi:hypothetical protein